MLMVIFGAGASYDSSPELLLPEPIAQIVSAGQQNFGTPPPPLPSPPTDPGAPWRPPLTKDLFLVPHDKFGEIVEKYPKLHGILPFLRRPRNGSVEQQLELYLGEASADEERKRQLLSVRYYLHDLFRMLSTEWRKRTKGVTNYAMLIEQIRHLNAAKEPVCLVTFNYDLLLDDALASLGHQKPPDVGPQPNAHPIFKLLKPHGSVDWARLLTSSSTRSRLQPQHLIERAHEIELSDSFVLANATDPTEIFHYNAPIVPAIAIPVQNKDDDTFERPTIHRDFFLNLLPSITRILIIGWQANEAHFLKLLREKLPSGGLTQISHLQVVASNSTEASDIAKRFLKSIRRNVMLKAHPGPTQGGFSTFVREEMVSFFYNN